MPDHCSVPNQLDPANPMTRHKVEEILDGAGCEYKKVGPPRHDDHDDGDHDHDGGEGSGGGGTTGAGGGAAGQRGAWYTEASSEPYHR